MDLNRARFVEGPDHDPEGCARGARPNAGDEVVFRLIEGRRAILAGTPDLLELAGSVPVPPEVRGLSWDGDPRSRLGRTEALIKRVQTRPNGTKRDRSSARRAPTGAPTEHKNSD